MGLSISSKNIRSNYKKDNKHITSSEHPTSPRSINKQQQINENPNDTNNTIILNFLNSHNIKSGYPNKMITHWTSLKQQL